MININNCPSDVTMLMWTFDKTWAFHYILNCMQKPKIEKV